jgi:imidazolonepropionase-like amidohydrolase/Tol biopolymer transport system component
MLKSLFLLLTCSIFSANILLSQDKTPKWDVNNPPGPFKEVDLTFKEGTWMNLDVSPDGKTIAFDLLGDIYTMPITGGEARLLRKGLAWEVQPRFSPNGQKILFTSDAGGGDNIWEMHADGTQARQITQESFRLLNNAVWMPDGQYFVARKHFTGTRSLGAGEMWMYHISGGEGMQLTKRKNDQQDVNEPCVSPDGRYVYFSEDVYPGGYFQYNKDPNSQIFALRRFDRQKDEIEDIAGGPGGACRPQISHDGKHLAFVRRVRTRSVLFLHNLETGEESAVWDGLDKDQQEAWSIFGLYPGFAWTPDDKHIVIWAQGKIWKIDIKNKTANPIPFTAKSTHRFQETLRFKNQVFSDEFDVKVIRQARTSPDGKLLVFNAAGYLWKKDLPNGTPVRLTQRNELEYEPAFSPDGKSIAYVTWTDTELGTVRIIDLSSGNSIQLTQEKGIFRTPSYSPDGKSLVFRKEGGNDHQGFTHSKMAGIYTVPAIGGKPFFVTPQGEYPQFNVDGSRIFVQTGGYLFGSLSKTMKSFALNGTDEKIIFTTQYTNQFVPSPDNKWIAFTELYKVYVAPMPLPGKPMGISAGTKAVPVAQVSRDAGISLHWSPDSKQLFWTLGDEYFNETLNRRFKFLEGAPDSIPPIDTTGLKIGLKLKSDKPQGKIAFKNARIITMRGDEVIEKGTIVVDGNRIAAIGPVSKTPIPSDAKVIDCSGKTIMPGLIDVHGHLGNFRYGISPQQQWHYFANLAYGVTTAHDPSSNSEMIFSQSEMIRSGTMTGPRLYSTGNILYGADGDFKAVINGLDDARSAIRRTKAYGAFSVKSYNQPRREQRQQVMQAARELGIIVVPEGGSFFYHNMSMVADGHTGVEHNIPVAPLYDDVIQFWKQTETHNTPTLIVNYGGLNGEYYWYQNTNVWEKERLLRFTPRAVIDSRARHRTMAPDEEYQNGHILTAQSCKKLQDAGVNINLGAHGQLQGLGAHWELWMFHQGGMSNMQALRSATFNGARYLGMDNEIGSLERGKLADLLVLDKNPLDNIRNSESIKYTMVNGRLYDAETMHEIGNYNRKRLPFFFEQEGSGNAWPMYGENQGFMHSGCQCGN